MVEEIAMLERTEHMRSSPIFLIHSITCKWVYMWVYKMKTRFDGSLERYNACLVARGFQQEHT
jgi:hypothetical protein